MSIGEGVQQKKLESQFFAAACDDLLYSAGQHQNIESLPLERRSLPVVATKPGPKMTLLVLYIEVEIRDKLFRPGEQ